MKRYTLLLVMALLLAFRSAGQTHLIPFGSSWKYLDNGSNQGASWRAPAFHDDSWKTGAGKFGYGYGDETTLVDYGSNAKKKYTTTYFRKTIVLADAAAFTSYTAKIIRDDGVLVFVNGVEVYRDNLHAGSVDHNTLAISAEDNGNKAQTFTIPSTATP
jgi:hypothetical protein